MKTAPCPFTRRRTRRALRLGVTLLLAWEFHPGRALADSTWTNAGTGNWFVAGNWNNGVPGPSDNAFINNGGLALINSPGARADLFEIGESGSGGGLSISNGGTLAVDFASYIGASTGSTGTVTVNGDGSRWSTASFLILGGTNSTGGGNGTMQIQAGGRVTSGQGSIGFGVSSTSSATITGAGSRWTINPTTLPFYIGENGRGTLTVSGGGTMDTSSPAAIAALGTATGAVTVTGANSVWVNRDNILVGGRGDTLAGGSASLRILAGGFVQATGLKVFSGGSVEVNNGSSAAPGLILSGTSSALTTSGALGDVTVGSTGSGKMSFVIGGTAFSRSGVIGNSAGASGAVTLQDPGSKWSNTGDVLVGNAGSGTLDIRGAAAVSGQRGYLGFAAGGGGTVTVSDPGSSWASSGSLFVGNDGSGNLQVLNGGLVSTAGSSYLGFSTTALGTATVSGAGSTWSTAQTLYIGGNALVPGGGFGSSLQIGDGGTVSAASITLYNTGALKLVNNTTLTGPLNVLGGLISTFGDTALTNDMTLGSQGVSVVTNTAGTNATFSGKLTGSGGLSKTGFGTGTLTLTGTNNYSGATTVNRGALLVNGSITSATTVNDGGTLGGTGTVGAITVNGGGILAPGASPGILKSGDVTMSLNSIFLAEFSGTAVGTGYDQLDVAGTVGLGNATLTLSPGFTPAVGTKFFLLNNDGNEAITGTFNGLAQGAAFTQGGQMFQVSYVGDFSSGSLLGGNDLVIFVVPEPSTLALLLAAAAGCLGLAAIRKTPRSI